MRKCCGLGERASEGLVWGVEQSMGGSDAEWSRAVVQDESAASCD